MGIKFKCEIKGLDNLERKINKIATELPQKVEESIEDILKNIQGNAIKLEKGKNEEGILVEMVETSTMEVKGRVYTSKDNMPYAMFEHWGTGDYRELAPVGTTKRFLETGGSQWFIPVSKVEKTLHYPIIEIQGSQFYIAHGVQANHFMTDAEFKTRNENKEIVQKKLKQFFEEVCK